MSEFSKYSSLSLIPQREVRHKDRIRIVTDVERREETHSEHGTSLVVYTVGAIDVKDGTLIFYEFGKDFARQLLKEYIQPPLEKPVPCDIVVTRHPSPTRAKLELNFINWFFTSQARNARATFSRLGFNPRTKVGIFDEIFTEKQSRIQLDKKGKRGFYVSRCMRLYYLQSDEPNPKKFVSDQQALLLALLGRADQAPDGKAQLNEHSCQRFATKAQYIAHSH